MVVTMVVLSKQSIRFDSITQKNTAEAATKVTDVQYIYNNKTKQIQTSNETFKNNKNAKRL